MFDLGKATATPEFQREIQAINAAIYCTELDSGKFIFANDAFARLLLYDVKFLLKCLKANSLYANETERYEWEHRVRQARGQLVATTVELVPNPAKNQEHQRLFVVDMSLLSRLDGRDVAFGILGDISREQIKSEHTANRLAAYLKLLDLPWLNVGIHEIDSQGKVVWMNKKEKELFGVDWDSGQHVTVLSQASDDRGKWQRVQRKILGTHPLTEGEHRTFFNAKDNLYIPVNIHDFPVREPDPIAKRQFNCGLVTAVRDEQTQFGRTLEQFLPQNPLLEDMELCTFIKVLGSRIQDFDANLEMFHGESEEFLFVFGNGPFLNEVRRLHQDETIDIIGKAEDELFPDFAGSYRKADDELMSRAREEAKAERPSRIQAERIEKHPSVEGGHPIDVQVIKIPLYCPGDVERRDPIGIQGFYWDVRKIDIHDQLERLHEPWNILNGIAVPVYRKDRNLRFTYANDKFLEDVVEITTIGEGSGQIAEDNEDGSNGQATNKKKRKVVRSLGDVIGRQDDDIFDTTTAGMYKEDDDKLIKNGVGIIDKVEPHGKQLVRVIKTAIIESLLDGDERIVGVQGIYWKLNQEELRNCVRFDWLTGKLQILGEKKVYNLEYELRQIPRYIQVFQLLINNMGSAVTTAEIGDEVWNDPKNKNGVHVEMTKLRKQLTKQNLSDRLCIYSEAGNYTLRLSLK